MLAPRRIVGLLLVAFYLILAGGATVDLADFSWTPSYFDDDDDDFLQNLLSDHTPMLSVPPVSSLAPAERATRCRRLQSRATPT